MGCIFILQYVFSDVILENDILFEAEIQKSTLVELRKDSEKYLKDNKNLWKKYVNKHVMYLVRAKSPVY